MAKRPWFSFYAGDWLNDSRVQLLTIPERGAYIQLLAVQWREGSIPTSKREIYRLIGYGAVEMICSLDQDKDLFDIDSVLSLFDLAVLEGCLPEGPSNPLVRRNKRLEEIRQEADAQHDRAVEAGRKGGKSKAKRKPSLAKASLEPGSSKSQSQSHTHKDLTPASAGQLVLVAEPEKPKAEKPKKQPNPDREAAIEVLSHYKKRWVEIFRPANGKPPTVTDADWSQLSRVVKEHGKEESIGFIDRYLAERDAFLVDQVHALRLFPGRIDRYRVTALPRVVAPTRPTVREPPKYQTLAEVEAARERSVEEIRALRDKENQA